MKPKGHLRLQWQWMTSNLGKEPIWAKRLKRRRWRFDFKELKRDWTERKQNRNHIFTKLPREERQNG